MTYDFDRLIDRRRSDSSKWQKYGPYVLPLWVADMDFQSPEPVIRALRERVEHGVYGYITFEQPEFHQLFADRLSKRYGWRVSPDAVVIIPGVIPGFNVAGRILAKPGDGLEQHAEVLLRLEKPHEQDVRPGEPVAGARRRLRRWRGRREVGRGRFGHDYDTFGRKTIAGKQLPARRLRYGDDPVSPPQGSTEKTPNRPAMPNGHEGWRPGSASASARRALS